MPNSPAAETLPLLDALLRWTDPALIEAIRQQERRLDPSMLRMFYAANPLWCRLIPIEEAGQTPAMDRTAEASGVFVPSIRTANSPPLTDAWRTAIRSFCAWLPRHAAITGVQTRPEPSPDRKPIPGAWASDAQIDFHVSALTIGDARYSAVEIAERSDDVRAQASISELTHRVRITPENVSELRAEELLLAVEEVHQRVARDALKMPSGKISVMPLVHLRMRERAREGKLHDTQAAECEELAAWAKSVAPSHQIPTPRSIGNELGKEYRRLRQNPPA